MRNVLYKNVYIFLEFEYLFQYFNHQILSLLYLRQLSIAIPPSPVKYIRLMQVSEHKMFSNQEDVLFKR